MTNEVRLFSELTEKSTMFNEAILKSSRSPLDAKLRHAEYQKVFATYGGLKELAKQFSGFTETPLAGNQYFNATIMSYVQSWAGFVAIERSMDQSSALLWFNDLLNAANNNLVMPNVGAENLNGINTTVNWSSVLTVGTSSYTITTGQKLIPGSINLVLTHSTTGGAFFNITDDSQGNLIAAPGVISACTINYNTGTISFTVGSAFTIVAGDSATLTAFADMPGSPDINGNGSTYRFKLDFKNLTVVSNPGLLIGESNLASLAAVNKSTGSNAQDILSAKLIELYTKIINENLVAAVVTPYAGTTVTIDLSAAATSFQDYRSQLDLFHAQLVSVNTAMARNSVKGIRATAYICGVNVGDQFEKGEAVGRFKKNLDSTYINDLLGWYDGVPVLRHLNIPDNDAYAIHKTADGAMAPVMRGIFLPLTSTPAIGNYNNPTQVANGVYFQEAERNIATALSQKFTLVTA